MVSLICFLLVRSNHIDMSNEEESSKSQELRVKSFNGKYLTITALTVIKQDVIKSINIKFQAISFDGTFYCLKCNWSAIPNGRFLLCNHCTCKTLLKLEKKSWVSSFSFQNQYGTVTFFLNLATWLVHCFCSICSSIHV